MVPNHTLVFGKLCLRSCRKLRLGCKGGVTVGKRRRVEEPCTAVTAETLIAFRLAKLCFYLRDAIIRELIARQSTVRSRHYRLGEPLSSARD